MPSTYYVYITHLNIGGQFSSQVILVKRNPSKDMEKNVFQLSKLSQSAFLLENPTHWDLETAVYQIFVKPV